VLSALVVGAIQDRVAVPFAPMVSALVARLSPPLLIFSLLPPLLSSLPPQPIKLAQISNTKLLVNSFNFEIIFVFCRFIFCFLESINIAMTHVTTLEKLSKGSGSHLLKSTFSWLAKLRTASRV